jgi:hypothetical protein
MLFAKVARPKRSRTTPREIRGEEKTRPFFFNENANRGKKEKKKKKKKSEMLLIVPEAIGDRDARFCRVKYP